LQGEEFGRKLCSCSPAVTKSILRSARASGAVNKAVLVNREQCIGLGGKGQGRLQEGEMLSCATTAGVQRWCQSC